MICPTYMETRSNDVTIHSGSPLEVKSKNYSRIVVCHRLILTIVIFSCSVTSVYSQQKRRFASVPYSEFFRRHNHRPHRERGLKKNTAGDKIIDPNVKDKKSKETKIPKGKKRTLNPTSDTTTTHPSLTQSFHPSSIPTLDNPSSIPSMETSLMPSFHPSSVPTLVNPSSSPTAETLNMSSPNSIVKIGFSILFDNSYIASDNQIDQLNEKIISSSLLKMFCENNTPVQFVTGSINSVGLNRYPCQTNNSSRTKIFAYSKDQSVEIRKLERVEVQGQLGTYMSDKWLNVTKKNQNGYSIPYFEVFVTYVILERGDFNIDNLRNNMQGILDENINTYLTLDRVEKFVSVGNERQGYRSNNLKRFINPKELDMGSSPMHGLQLVGVILMISVIMSYVVIVKTAQNRHSRKVWDAINRNEDKGGLGTAEGLDIILNGSGRNLFIEESCEQKKYDDNI